MTPFRWNSEKNETLKQERGVSFESMVVAVTAGGLLDVFSHPNKKAYPNQKVMVVAIDGYAYLVPYIVERDYFFLKTIIPSRKATREYLKHGDEND